jgi:hypothetical protein
MPEVNQILFNHKELLEILIKKAGVHEGKWTIIANFGFSAGNFGPSPDQMTPGAVVALLQVGIASATLDAGIVNPIKKTAST